MAEPTMPAVEGQTASETQQNTSNESDEQPTLTTTAGPVPTPSPLPPQSDESGSEESDWEQVGSDQGEDETVPLPPKEPPVYPNPGYVWINLDESEETSNLFRDAVPEGRDASLCVLGRSTELKHVL